MVDVQARVRHLIDKKPHGVVVNKGVLEAVSYVS